MQKAEPYPYDTNFVAQCREMQSKYREEILCIPLRPYIVQNSRSKDYGRVFLLGNYISGGEESGANFLEEYIFYHAKERIRDRKPYETFDEDRMFNNLLSSQPMAFNLFCPLRKLLDEDRKAATEAIRKALPNYSIAEVTKIELEFIPSNYMELTGDKSAMDAIIEYIGEDGKEGFIAIETKYSENLGSNTASFMKLSGEKYEEKRKRYFEKMHDLELFLPDIESKLRNNDKEVKLTQLYRNFILSETYGKIGKKDRILISNSVVLAPAGHPSTEIEIETLQSQLLPHAKDKIRKVILEDFVDSLIEETGGEYKKVFEKFKKRYLDWK
ncbi:MAG: hypothetical protein IJ383_02760 [Bacteroidales bacterium]|nr:hypothetical protein [Bacteroidales bacterium]